jgi:hypothetical protein
MKVSVGASQAVTANFSGEQIMTSDNENNDRGKQSPSKRNVDKPGSNPDAARDIGGKGDFGIPAKEAIEQAKHKDDEYAGRPKGSQMSQTGEGSAREHGVGAKGGKRGRGSGGELDPDVIGFGTPGGGGITSGPLNEPPGPDDADKAIDASQGKRRVDGPNIGGDKRVQGDTVDHSGGDKSTTGSGAGTAAVANTGNEEDDAFAGEVSNDEATGADNSPSDNRP